MCVCVQQNTHTESNYSSGKKRCDLFLFLFFLLTLSPPLLSRDQRTAGSAQSDHDGSGHNERRDHDLPGPGASRFLRVLRIHCLLQGKPPVPPPLPPCRVISCCFPFLSAHPGLSLDRVFRALPRPNVPASDAQHRRIEVRNHFLGTACTRSAGC